MPTGLSIPVGVNPTGGVATVSGDINDDKIVKSALGSDDNQNPFQQGLGVGLDMIFDLDDPSSRPAIQAKIQEVFRRFQAQRRYKLVDDTLRWRRGEQEGELELSLKYVSLEADEERLYRRKFSASGAGGNGDA